ncbi:MAG: HD-GYP domain-containing protein [Candidatus Kapaibacteriota bacterium]|jgi:putative nucleotidyltransferase with HDIG domain
MEEEKDTNASDNLVEINQKLNLQLKEKQEKIQQLEEILDAVSTKFANSIFQFVDILAAIVSFQEKFYENSHSRFVSRYSVKLAKALRMGDDEILNVQIAGLLHDIGKVGFKDNIMIKFPHEMSEKERSYYNTHCELGKEILKKFQEFNLIADIIFQHHENIDGSGFPQGLKDKQIHPEAQIIAIVNTFHNLVYKVRKESDPRTMALVAQTTLPPSKVDIGGNRYLSAIKSLHERSGLHFNKKFVEVFINLMEEERASYGQKVVSRVPVTKLETGMVIYQNYYTRSGLLVASSGDVIDEDSRRALIRLAEFGAIPANILVLK